MNKIIIAKLRAVSFAACAALIMVAFASCSKKEAAPADAEKTKEEKHDENVVTLTKANLQHVEIKTEPVTRGNLETTLKAAGRVSENMNKTAKVVSTLEGRLIKLNYDLNDHVKAGDVVALVQTPELLGKPLEVKAPIDGVITERKSTAGESIAKNTEIYIDQRSHRPMGYRGNQGTRHRRGENRTRRDFYGARISRTKRSAARLCAWAIRWKRNRARLEVRIEVNNSDGRLKPGMFADVEIVTTVLRDVLAHSRHGAANRRRRASRICRARRQQV